MRFNFLLLFILLSLSIPSFGETMDDLVKRNGLYYKKFTDVPFTGEVEGNKQGSFKDGKKEGSWATYWDNGQLRSKGAYKNGTKDGFCQFYWMYGRIRDEGSFKNGTKHGMWVGYWEKNGSLQYEQNYKNDQEDSYKFYWENGQLGTEGIYLNGQKEGLWRSFWEDGSVRPSESGTYKNGVKISD